MENKIREELKKVDLIQEGLRIVENSLCKYLWKAYENKLSISELYKYEETEQITGKFTTNVCDYFMQWIILEGNKYLKSKNSSLRILDRKKPIKDKDKDKEMSFDIIFEFDGVEVKYEIKFSQGNNAFQGSTHGKNKVPNFILIQFSADLYRVILENNKNILGDVWIGIIHKKPEFTGTPTEGSSRTGFSITKYDYDIDEMLELTILGDVKPRTRNWKKWQIIGDKIN
jgi:hypothetical protein